MFELLADQIKDNIGIFTTSETKFNESFPTSQFFMNCFISPHRLIVIVIVMEFFYMLGRIYHQNHNPSFLVNLFDDAFQTCLCLLSSHA